jgi:hypothetical protein
MPKKKKKGMVPNTNANMGWVAATSRYTTQVVTTQEQNLLSSPEPCLAIRPTSTSGREISKRNKNKPAIPVRAKISR